MSAGFKIGAVVVFVLLVGFVIWAVQQPTDVVQELPEGVDAQTQKQAADISLAGDQRRRASPTGGALRPRTRAPTARDADTVGGSPEASQSERVPTGLISDAPRRPEEVTSPPAGQAGPGESAQEKGDVAGGPLEAREPDSLKPDAGGEPEERPPPGHTPGPSLPAPDKPLQRPARRAAAAPAVAGQTHTIRPGDRLIDLAREYYGDEDLWRAIKQANPGIDENRLRIGQQVTIPPEAEARRMIEAGAVEPPARRTEATKPTAGPGGDVLVYVVERGDTLIGIARNVLGDESRWREIYELNLDALDSPHQLRIGMKLKLPPRNKQP
jgi:nucleoid-associated protein YgaU